MRWSEGARDSRMTAAVPCLLAAFLDWLSMYRSVSSMISSPMILCRQERQRKKRTASETDNLGLTLQPSLPLRQARITVVSDESVIGVDRRSASTRTADDSEGSFSRPRVLGDQQQMSTTGLEVVQSLSRGSRRSIVP
jgi:hypothetical protein